MPRLSSPLGKTLGALLAAWVTMIFGTSALIALFRLSPRERESGHGFLRSVFEVADEMAPLAKLLLIALFAAAVTLGARAGGTTVVRRHAINIVLGIGAMLLTLLIIPAHLSRGFGVGLTGARMDRAVLPVYLAGAVLGAIVYTRMIMAEKPVP